MADVTNTVQGDSLQVAKEWFEYSKRDLDSAKYLLQMKPMPLEIICYHCQQSAEKALKGYLANKKISFQKIHDLGILLNSCINISPDFNKIKNECSRLTDYGVQARYPFAMEIEEADVSLALSDANAIWLFIQNELF